MISRGRGSLYNIQALAVILRIQKKGNQGTQIAFNNWHQLSKMTRKNEDWDSCLPFVLFAYRSSVVYMPAAKSGMTHKLARPYHGPYHVVWVVENGIDVRPASYNINLCGFEPGL